MKYFTLIIVVAVASIACMEEEEVADIALESTVYVAMSPEEKPKRECEPILLWIDKGCEDSEIEIIQQSVDSINRAANGDVVKIAGFQWWLDRSYEVSINMPDDQMIFCLETSPDGKLASYNGTDIDMYVPKLEVAAAQYGRTYEEQFACTSKHEILHLVVDSLSEYEHIPGPNVMNPGPKYCMDDYSVADAEVLNAGIDRNAQCAPIQ